MIHTGSAIHKNNIQQSHPTQFCPLSVPHYCDQIYSVPCSLLSLPFLGFPLVTPLTLLHVCFSAASDFSDLAELKREAVGVSSWGL